MSDKTIIMTYDGVNKMRDELQQLKVVRRKDVAQKLHEARGQGDISENAEYDAAKDEQNKIETRINELEAILKDVVVVTQEDVNTDRINIGCTVELLDTEFDEKLEYKIVGTTEAKSLEGMISNESPLGKALIGAAKGDTIKVDAPAGEIEYKILSIRKTENN